MVVNNKTKMIQKIVNLAHNNFLILYKLFNLNRMFFILMLIEQFLLFQEYDLFVNLIEKIMKTNTIEKPMNA